MNVPSYKQRESTPNDPSANVPEPTTAPSESEIEYVLEVLPKLVQELRGLPTLSSSGI